MGYQIMKISSELFFNLLKPLEMRDGKMWAFHTTGLPDDLKIVAATYNLEYDRWDVKVESESFRKLPLNSPLEECRPLFYRTWVREITEEEFKAEAQDELDKIMDGDPSKPTPQGVKYSNHDVWMCRLREVLADHGWQLQTCEELDDSSPGINGKYNIVVVASYRGKTAQVLAALPEDHIGTELAVKEITSQFNDLHAASMAPLGTGRYTYAGCSHLAMMGDDDNGVWTCDRTKYEPIVRTK